MKPFPEIFITFFLSLLLFCNAAQAQELEQFPNPVELSLKKTVRLAANGGLNLPLDRVDTAGVLALLAHQDPKVRYAAVYSLGEMRDPEAVDPLIGLLQDPDPCTRRIAAHALGKLGDPRAVAPLMSVLNRAEENLCVQCVTASALGRLGDQQPVQLLLRLVDQAPEKRLQREALEALERIAPELARQRLPIVAHR